MNTDIIAGAITVIALLVLGIALYRLYRSVLYDAVAVEFELQRRIDKQFPKDGRWQSMELAPRDGTEIVLLCYDGSIQFARWDMFGQCGWHDLQGPIEENPCAWFKIPVPLRGAVK